jgi:hypothetical protein
VNVEPVIVDVESVMDSAKQVMGNGSCALALGGRKSEIIEGDRIIARMAMWEGGWEVSQSVR